MAVPCIILLGRLIVESVGESVNSLVSDCCSEKLVLNGTCPAEQRCSPVTTQALEIHMNHSTTPSSPHHLSNPGIAASLLLGTFFICLFLVLSVASFFYLKRSYRLPEMFYRSNKASILQPSEMASMIPNPSFTGRKPRYVRRERTHKSSAPVLLASSEDTQVSNV
ncbi:uncharacterized protein C1orf159 homolog isoform X2 [Rana temporaria]|uniref:uncharacterized protein C1orf159 homolog isoform X2 n=1 Tax=Rana temporaria TaxID=8407 RepID=UPI001AAD2CE3|nr:uncharacterized protein C1orf159 homolog isoform X2 [Rana temporaria]